MLDRTDPAAAARIFEPAIPDAPQRRAFLKLMAAAIREAHAEGSATWSVTLERTRVRLNVGRAVVLDAREGRSFLLVRTDRLPAGLQAQLAEAGEAKGSPQGYPDLAWWRRVPCEWIGERAEALRPAVLAAVRQLAERSRRTNHGRAWSPGVVEYLEQELNETLPRADHPDPGIAGSVTRSPEELRPEFDELLPEFAEWLREDPAGQTCLATTADQRAMGQAGWSEIDGRLKRSEPVAPQDVLDRLLPHPAGDEWPGGTRSVSGAWARRHAPLTRGVRHGFESAGRPAASDWAGAATLLTEFVRTATSPGGEDAPRQHLSEACQQFGASPLAPGFDGALLSPILEAIDPSRFRAVDEHVVRTLSILGPLETDAQLEVGRMAQMQDAYWEFIAECEPAIVEIPGFDGVDPADVVDAFVHWFTHVWPLTVEHPPGIDYWKIAPDKEASKWDLCREGEFILVGWPKGGDLRALDRKTARHHFVSVYENENFSAPVAKALYEFPRIPIGSYIVANRGTKMVVGIGRVVGPSPYAMRPEVDPDLPNHLRVDWHDVEPRRVHYPSWFQTFQRLSADDLEAIDSAPLLGDTVAAGTQAPPLFQPAAFELLRQLAEHPVKATVEALKADLRSRVHRPLRRLIEIVSKRMPPVATEHLETSKRLLSRFLKNDFGRGGAAPCLWAAFYPLGESRINAPQLFVWVGPNHIEIGFGTKFAAAGEDDALRDRIRTRADVLEPWMREQLGEGLTLRFGVRESDFDPPTGDDEIDLHEWLADPPGGLAVRYCLTDEEVTRISESALCDLVESIFVACLPLMLLACVSDPDLALTKLGVIDSPDPPDPPIIGVIDSPGTSEPYTLDDAEADLFMPREEIEKLSRLIRRKRNVMLQGPPGTGKTYAARRLASLVVGHRGPGHVEMVQFHPSYSYEDFVQGLRPGGEAGLFVLKDGVFHRFCAAARARPDEPFVFIIDEINRGNLGRILGELMVLIERDKRGPRHSMRLAHGSPKDEPFWVPENVHILGLMNTADRSLAVVDYALRRRFAFKTLEPGFETDGFRKHLDKAGCPADFAKRVIGLMTALNDAIRKSRLLGPGFEIGHSFLTLTEADRPTPGHGRSGWDAWWTEVLEYEIQPLIEEYCFDDLAEAQRLMSQVGVVQDEGEPDGGAEDGLDTKTDFEGDDG